MARLSLAVVLLALLAAGVWLAVGGGPGGGADAEDTGGGRAVEAGEGGDGDTGSGGAAGDGATRSDADGGGAAGGDGNDAGADTIPDDERIPSFTGRVLDPTGAPAADAQVEAWGMVGFAAQLAADGGGGRNTVVHWTTRSAADGSFRLPEAPREGLRYLLRVHAAGAAPLLLRNLPAVPGRTRDLGPLQLDLGAAVQGTVQAADGSALAGATLRAYRWTDDGGPPTRAPLAGGEAVSAADGGFRIAHLPPGTLRIQATAPGHAEGWSAPFDHGRDGDSEVALRLPAARALTGVVLDTDRAPLADARIVLRAHPRQAEVPDALFEATSAADGSFRMLLPRSVREGLLGATAAGHYRAQTALRLADEEPAPLELLLAPLPELAGRCLVRGGGAAAGAEVLLLELRAGVSDPTALPVVARATSDADGRWRLEPDLREVVDLRFQVRAVGAAGARAESGRFTLVDPATTTLPSFELTLDPGLAVDGVVRREDGAPVAGARVLLRKLEYRQPSRLPGVDETRLGGSVVDRATSDADGRFRFAGHAVGDYRVEAFLPGATPGESAEFALIDRAVQTEVRLAPAGALAGQVVGPFAELGPLQVLASAPGLEPMAAEVGSDGRFRFDAPWPAQWTLELRETPALAEGTAFVFGGTEPLARVDGVRTEAGRETEARLTLDFAGLGTIAGRAQLDGAPAVGFRVFLLPTDLTSQGDPRLDGRSLMRRMRIARTDADGRFRIAGVAADEGWLVLCRPGTWPEGMFGGALEGEVPTGLQAQRVRVQPDEVLRADFAVVTGGLRIRVDNADRDTLTAAARLTPVDGRSRSYAFTLGAEGHLVTRLPAGAYTLVLVSGGALRSEIPVQVPAGAIGEVGVVLAEPHMLPAPDAPEPIRDEGGR